MKKKKVVYQITRKKYQLIEVETKEQEELIKELNRDFEREDKREKVLQARNLSLDEFFEPGAIVDDSPNAEDIVLRKEHCAMIKKIINKALSMLSPRQKEIVIKVFFEEKSQAEIAKELGITEGTVSVTLDRAKTNLRKILKKIKKIF